MKGSYHVIVQNNRLRYEFDIKRNITIIRGDSATGKTTLINMIESASELGESSGIDVLCKKQCVVLRGSYWKAVLGEIHDSIVFIDEENAYVKSTEFARAISESDNYYVIVTRENLPNLPYSVQEIYGIHASGKYHDLKRTYNEFFQIYSSEELTDKISPKTIIVEDSHSGYEFFMNVCKEKGIVCKSAGGKSNLKQFITLDNVVPTLVVADGAAIGSEMNELYQLMKRRPQIKCYLPESFEWLILKSGLIDGKTIQGILEQPEEYIDSREYFSWERYFYWLLKEWSKDTYLNYSKGSLNENYLNDKEKTAILRVMEGVQIEKVSNEQETIQR